MQVGPLIKYILSQRGTVLSLEEKKKVLIPRQAPEQTVDTVDILKGLSELEELQLRTVDTTITPDDMDQVPAFLSRLRVDFEENGTSGIIEKRHIKTIYAWPAMQLTVYYCPAKSIYFTHCKIDIHHSNGKPKWVDTIFMTRNEDTVLTYIRREQKMIYCMEVETVQRVRFNGIDEEVELFSKNLKFIEVTTMEKLHDKMEHYHYQSKLKQLRELEAIRSENEKKEGG
ncbi:hypothetical protein HCJ57_15695 [Listeria booriae]|uniref:hypothetical protein n=1 Tax=Listeria booriae TaxID=1552123 RepID=UPI00162A7FFF|nr:hypothetical protein [Listeria booriae]MBC2057969.1 hypothetical protein [Listeria booriae]